MSQADAFLSRSVASAVNQFVIEPHDTNPLPHTTRAIRVGGEGTINVALVGDPSLFIVYPVATGETLSVQAVHVKDDDTTATDLVGWY